MAFAPLDAFRRTLAPGGGMACPPMRAPPRRGRPARRCATREQQGTPQREREVAEKLLKRLRAQLQEAVREEDYCKAVELRDAILEEEARDPVLQLRARMEAAIEQQDFEAAAACRDELKVLDPPPAPRVPAAAPPPTLSDTVTNGLRVQVKSSFLPHRSMRGSYVFMYRIRLRNESETATYKLQSRHWQITDANLQQEVVRGVGVVGETPVLAPGEEFVYGSYCPIATPTGKMVGTFRMLIRSEDGAWVDGFDAVVGLFGLDMSDATPAQW